MSTRWWRSSGPVKQLDDTSHTDSYSEDQRLSPTQEIQMFCFVFVLWRAFHCRLFLFFYNGGLRFLWSKATIMNLDLSLISIKKYLKNCLLNGFVTVIFYALMAKTTCIVTCVYTCVCVYIYSIYIYIYNVFII